MADLHERLRAAGKSLDEQAPTFDPVSLMARAPEGDDESPVVALSADSVPESGPRRRAVRTAIVAAAVVLVVVAAGVAVLRAERDTVSTGPAASLPGGPEGGDGATAGSSAPASIGGDAPDAIEVTCNADATVLSASTVRAHADGVHVQVHNPHPMAEVLLEIGDASTVGAYRRGVPFGATDLVLAIRPGLTDVACHETGAASPMVTVEVLDAEGLWRDPTIGCLLPSSANGYGDGLERGPYRSTPDGAVRAWSGVLDDTVVRQVGYPDEPTRRYLAELSGGDVLFGVSKSDDGTWSAAVQQWCTGVRPSVREADDPAQAWYDREGIGKVRDDLGRRVEVLGADEATPAAERLTAARLWCTDLRLQSRLLGDTPAPAVDLEALRQAAVDELMAAIVACPEDEASLSVDGPFRESDEHVEAAKRTLDDLRRLVDAAG